MPKGRHLKPEFFTDKHIVSMTPLARLLYEGLWCYAADCGHLDDEPFELKMRILPADNCDVEELLGEIVANGRIERKDGVIYLPKLSDHARVDKRYETFCDACKALRDHAGDTPSKGSPKAPTTTGTRSGHTVTTQGTQRDHDADGDGDGDGEVMVKGKARAVRLPAEWQPTPSHETRALEDGIDLQRQVEKFKAHAAANDRRQVNWNASFTTWLLGVPTWERGRPSTGQTLPFPDNGTQDEKDEWARSQPRAAGGWS